MTFTALDIGILAIVFVSALFSIMRGFVREAASIISWVAAFVVTGNFYPKLADLLTFSSDSLTRSVLAIVIIFVVTLVAVGFVCNLICSLIKKAGLSGTDRLLGVVFGVLRGILIVCALLALVQILVKLHILYFITETQWWKESVFVPELMRIVEWFFKYMGTPVTGG